MSEKLLSIQEIIDEVESFIDSDCADLMSISRCLRHHLTALRRERDCLPELLKINPVYGNSGHPSRLAMAQEILALRKAANDCGHVLAGLRGGGYLEGCRGAYSVIEEVERTLRAALTPEATDA